MRWSWLNLQPEVVQELDPLSCRLELRYRSMLRVRSFAAFCALVVLACGTSQPPSPGAADPPPPPPATRPPEWETTVDGKPCERSFDERSYESALRGLSCPLANAFDRCGGKASTCGRYRVLEEDLGLSGVTRYYDEHGELVATESYSFEWPGAPHTLSGELPKCRITGQQVLCTPRAGSKP